MGQWLEALAAFTEDLNSVTRIQQKTAHDQL